MATDKATPRAMPKGGRKGGAVFPRIPLADALKYSRKLVSKTHSGAQPADIIFSGVVGAKAGLGDVRISALRQYALLSGDKQRGFVASSLAKQVASAPEDELPKLHRQAALSPKVFKGIFDAFHGDTVSRAKLRQRAGDLKVHPDELDSCIDVYLGSLSTAGLVSVDGDQVTHLTAPDAVAAATAAQEDLDRASGDDVAGSPGAASPVVTSRSMDGSEDELAESAPRAARSIVNVNITLDSSMDVDKLSRQLELLKKFGAI